MTEVATSEPACLFLLHLLRPLASHVACDCSRPWCHRDLASIFKSFFFFINTHLCLSPICLFFPPTSHCFCFHLPSCLLAPHPSFSAFLFPSPPLNSPPMHTCSGTQPCASQPGQGGEQTAPVFYDNHHIACMPALLFFWLSSL